MPINEQGLYYAEDIAFCNTKEFSATARLYKHNASKGNAVYTKAPPDSREYKEFWDIEEDRRKNGMTLPGKLIYEKGVPRMQEVHITGEYYGFLNYARILRTKEDDLIELRHLVKDSPLLKNARKVGRKDMDFPSFMDGQYHWFTAKAYAQQIGNHIVMAKARRKGYSYMEGWDAADTVNMNPYLTVLVGAYDFKYITLGKQIMPMAKGYLDFLELHTDFNRGFLKESIDHIKMGYRKTAEGQKEFGYRSELVAVSFMNNPDAAVGKDAVKIKLEECGKFPNLQEALDVTLSTTEDGSIQTGFVTMFGTGGTDDANWVDFEKIFYNPEKNNCLIFENIWDEGAMGTGCGYFHPQELGDPLYIDDHGNSLKEAANAHNDAERLKKKKVLSSPEYLKYIGQRARSPKEAFASGSDNIFPAVEILDQLQKVEHDPDYKYLARIGALATTDKGIKFKLNSDIEAIGGKIHEPVENFPLKPGQDVTGAYVEWISPYRDQRTGLIPKGLYRIWHDPYAHDKEAKDITIKDSLGATYVYERLNNITPGRGDYLVACYVGRPPRMDDYNDNLFKIAEYWNGEIMFENDRGDVKGFAGRAKKLHMLANSPDLEWEAELKGKANRGKGINMTDKRKAKGAIYLRDWLLEPRGKDVYGNSKLNLHYIYDPALLRELLKWNSKGNFDRVSSLLVGMYDMKECFHLEVKAPPIVDSSDFFNRSLF